MDFLKRTAGKILYGFTDLLSMLLDLIINIIDFVVSLVAGVARGCGALISGGGCLILFLLFSPYGIYLLTNPVVILAILFFVVFPILGTKFVSFLKYIKYILTEYLYDRANYLIDGQGGGFKSFDEYSNRYKRMEEERKREEYRQQQQEQQRIWEERFRQWNEYQRQQQGGRQDFWGQNQGYGNYGNNTYQNPSVEFKKKYEESCDLLGINYDADKYEIKLAYRKKAKEYHPDINKAANATEMFQKINDAYEFLNDDNIERYKKL